ncbi:putative ATP-dependent endonuclease of OLD family [Bradyrhizobium yuanmingense]|uniref:ATP-dependent nuclease n=1 Tax=Bradyrhizobium yuanmingense TaxID=108015 RepID=UPI003511490F
MPLDPVTAPTIRRLSIQRFRSIKSMTWRPASGLNLILGGGDVGKTTILDAVALLLSPNIPGVVPDTDYCGRQEEDGFVIDAVISLPDDSRINSLLKAAWPWDWDGEKPVVPSIDGDGAHVHNDPVYWLQVTGTPELDLVYEIKQPDGTSESMPVALRRQLNPVRLSSDDRNDRDLRFVQGSALDRLLSDKTLRSRLSSRLAETNVVDALNDDSKLALGALSDAFATRSLPTNLDLSITGAPGISVMALIGLTAERDSVQLPLSSWGAGTRRLSALAIAEQTKGATPITLVDEIERGLEPYRQRVLIAKLGSSKAQALVTTHSAAAISAAASSTLWYVDHAGNIGKLDGTKVAQQRARDPETFLSRLAIVCEGITEVGFTTRILVAALGTPLEQAGIRVVDGGGHETTLGVLEALAEGGLRFGGFADDEEGKHPTRWKKLEECLGKLLFRWQTGCLEENIIKLVPEAELETFIKDPAGVKTGKRLRSLQERMGTDGKEFAILREKAGDNLRQFIIEAATGKVPEGKESERKHFQSHSQDWFKSFAGGQELAGKVFMMELWPQIKDQIVPFANAVRGAVMLSEITDIAL